MATERSKTAPRPAVGAVGRALARAGRAALTASLAVFALACGEVEPPEDADEFCSDYAAVCGFDNDLGGDPLADEDECLLRFRTFTPAREECAIEHLTFALRGDDEAIEANCPRAEGGDPCDRESTFCRQYEETCGFDNDRGGDPYADADDCRARYDALETERQTCVKNHLEFAVFEADPDTHCPHAEGQPPCDEDTVGGED